jgi:AraC-like DNA-binding protein
MNHGPCAGAEHALRHPCRSRRHQQHRRYLEALPPTQTGWLAGLRDPLVGQALAALHAAPMEEWTVERLARLVGVSRSIFAERFSEMVGQPPMQYLALWRMQLASRLLADGGQLAAVAAAVGYESEAEFSRAFKKLVGQAPAAWRRDVSPLASNPLQ